MSDTDKANSVRRATSRIRRLRRGGLVAAAAGAVALSLLSPTSTSVVTIGSAAVAQDPAQPWMDTSLSADQRAALLLAAMTLEEKVDLMTGNVEPGVVGFSNNAIPRLGIPALRMADAGSGLRRPAGASAATAMPGPIALAATWDRELGPEYGETVSKEAFALRNNVVLGPNADISRNPWFGRIGETSGEDPELSAEMTKDLPGGAQIPGVMTTYKHPMLYTQETNRGKGTNAIADERTIREVYAPSFEAAIKGGAGSVMCSFNKINGDYACESDYMQNKLLRDAFGFKGFIQSDYLATHSTSPEKGLDMEEPGTPVFAWYGQTLLNEVNNGQTSIATIDQAVTRILWAMFKTGLFDNTLPATDQPIPYAEHAAVAQQIEENAITLLQNKGNVLPLEPGKVGSIAVIGADADRPSRLGGSSFVTIPSDSRGLLEGIQDRAPAGVEVRSAPGTDRIASGDGVFTGFQALSSSVQRTPDGQPGVRSEFYTSNDLSGTPTVRIDPDATYNVFAFNRFQDIVREGPPLTTRSLRSTSTMTVPTTGEYQFSLSGWGDATLWIDGQVATTLHSPGIQGSVNTAPMTLQAGSQHSIRIEFRATGARAGGLEPGSVQLGWKHPDNAYSPDMKAAAALAADSDVAIVYARTVECEQEDSGILSLGRDQDTLIRAVAAANPNTIVVLGTGAPALTPWKDQVAGIVQSYFGGQEQGDALARALFGDVNPSGKLPYTMAASEAQYETIGIQNPVTNESNLNVPFNEGLLVGYRGFDKFGLTPHFPFGYGLSYTTFDYGKVNVTPGSTDGTRPVKVRFRLTNTGSRAGAEVAQVYLSAPTSTGEPMRKLVGFEKVMLNPGETRTVVITIDHNDVTHPLSYWDTGAGDWKTAAGTYTVAVGSSSRDLPQQDSFRVR